MFVAVQHPADGGDDWAGGSAGRLTARTCPPAGQTSRMECRTRPSVVVITKQGGGKIAL